MAGDTRSHHQFAVSNDAGVVIRCCIHCGLSHQMESYQDQRTNRSRGVWSLILEEREYETFAEPCPGESGSDDLFPYHHFILSNHHRQISGNSVLCSLRTLASFDLGVALHFRNRGSLSLERKYACINLAAHQGKRAGHDSF
jgi:hypothetical protein